MKKGRPWVEACNQLNEMDLQKLEQDGLDIIDKFIHIYSKEGFAAIPKQKFNLCKWMGMDQQGPKADNSFMIRIRVPSGILNFR